MRIFRWLRSVPIGVLSLLNFVVMGTGWLLDYVVLDPMYPRTDRYPPSVLLLGLVMMSFLPYYVVTREDSGHGLMYVISYFFLIVFIWIDLGLFARLMKF